MKVLRRQRCRTVENAHQTLGSARQTRVSAPVCKKEEEIQVRLSSFEVAGVDDSEARPFQESCLLRRRGDGAAAATSPECQKPELQILRYFFYAKFI